MENTQSQGSLRRYSCAYSIQGNSAEKVALILALKAPQRFTIWRRIGFYVDSEFVMRPRQKKKTRNVCLERRKNWRGRIFLKTVMVERIRLPCHSVRQNYVHSTCTPHTLYFSSGDFCSNQSFLMHPLNPGCDQPMVLLCFFLWALRSHSSHLGCSWISLYLCQVQYGTVFPQQTDCQTFSSHLHLISVTIIEPCMQQMLIKCLQNLIEFVDKS